MSQTDKIPDQVFGVKVGERFIESSFTHDYGQAITEANERNGTVVTYTRTEN